MPTSQSRADVLIVGSGAAGLSAAIEAVAAGATVMVFEKMGLTGGNTRISDGGLAAAGNHLQRRLGVADSPRAFLDDMRKAGLGLNHPHLVRTVAEQSAGAVEWTRKELGVRYQDRLDRFGGHSVPRCLTTRSHCGADIVKAQIAWLGKRGVTVRTRCRLTRLLTDAAGSVTGLQVRSGYQFPDETSGRSETVLADRAVVLATGGFGGDLAFRMLQNPKLDASVTATNHRGATAEGLVAALETGAAPVHLSWIQLGPWGCVDEPGYGQGSRFASYSVFPEGILIDPATGRRIVDEWADRRLRSDAMFATGRVCVGIVDAQGARKEAASLQNCLKSGKVKGFDRLADLAGAYGMPPDALIATVDAYNRRVEQRQRDEFGKPLDRGATPLAAAPYYAIRLWPKVHYTPGGVGIDAHARVIDLHGRPIPRLFAAGEVCGGIHGAGRLGSCALTECIVFGRIAGRQAAGASASIRKYGDV